MGTATKKNKLLKSYYTHAYYQTAKQFKIRILDLKNIKVRLSILFLSTFFFKERFFW